VTIEDILELVIADEIYDEADFDQKNNLNVNFVGEDKEIKKNPFFNPKDGLKDLE
jgi:Mg2+/Co2+ transporter CorC